VSEYSLFCLKPLFFVFKHTFFIQNGGFTHTITLLPKENSLVFRALLKTSRIGIDIKR
jgi:hypothetical protein